MEIIPLHFVSFSSLNNFHTCPRKYELIKMGESGPGIKSFDFSFGKALGAGIQELLESGDLGKASLKAFLIWDLDLLMGIEIDPDSKKDNHKKSFPNVLDALVKFLPHLQVISSEWELFYFKSYDENKNEVLRPAVELSATIELPNGFKYRCYIDVVLKNKNTGQLVVLELKSTGSTNVQEAMYGNSNQALSYSVILDCIADGYTSFFVWYFVYCTTMEKWEYFPFSKTRVQKAEWIKTVLYDTGNIEECIENDFFPKQGESCLSFGRPCQFYGGCGMSNRNLYAGPLSLAQRVKEELDTSYNFSFTLQELVDQQLKEVHGN